MNVNYKGSYRTCRAMIENLNRLSVYSELKGAAIWNGMRAILEGKV